MLARPYTTPAMRELGLDDEPRCLIPVDIDTPPPRLGFEPIRATGLPLRLKVT
jgi:hypothetical protein